MAQTACIAKTYIFDREGNLLVLKRHNSMHHRPDGPDLVGGSVEGDEHYIESAVREAHEEAGIVVNQANTKLFFANTYMIKGHNIVHLYLVAKLDEVKPAVTISWEHSAYQWVAPEAIDAALHDAPNMLLAYHYGLNNHLL